MEDTALWNYSSGVQIDAVYAVNSGTLTVTKQCKTLSKFLTQGSIFDGSLVVIKTRTDDNTDLYNITIYSDKPMGFDSIPAEIGPVNNVDETGVRQTQRLFSPTEQPSLHKSSRQGVLVGLMKWHSVPVMW